MLRRSARHWDRLGICRRKPSLILWLQTPPTLVCSIPTGITPQYTIGLLLLRPLILAVRTLYTLTHLRVPPLLTRSQKSPRLPLYVLASSSAGVFKRTGFGPFNRLELHTVRGDIFKGIEFDAFKIYLSVYSLNSPLFSIFGKAESVADRALICFTTISRSSGKRSPRFL